MKKYTRYLGVARCKEYLGPTRDGLTKEYLVSTRSNWRKEYSRG